MESKTIDFIPQLEKQRDISIDVAKAVLIALVVWGHAIQYLHGTDFNYWEDPVFKFIYGFHMPLFAMISGYLLKSSVKRYTTRSLLVKKAKQLLIPVIGWAIVLTVIDLFLRIIAGGDISAFWIASVFFSRIVYNLWFLKAIFISFVVVLFIEKCFSGHWIPYLIVLVLTLFCIKKYDIELYGFVLPFYVIGFKVGYALKLWNDEKTRIIKTLVFLTSAIVYIVMLKFFHRDNYIYTSGLNVLCSELGFFKQIVVDTYRVIVALVGCVMILEGSVLISGKWAWITKLSNKTMMIYVVTASVFSYIPLVLNNSRMDVLLGSLSPSFSDFAILIPVSILIILLALALGIVIEKLKLGKRLLGR